MKYFQNFLTFSIMVSLLISFSSCETSKIAYGNSYYFKATPKTVTDKQKTLPAPEANQLEANLSSQPEVLPDIERQVVQVEKKLKKLEEAQNKVEEVKALTTEMSKSELRKLQREEKMQRRALKKEVKSLVKEYKRSPENVEEQSKVSGNLRTGIILGAAGLVLVLIGGPILYLIGVILLVIGLVLILLDVL